MTTTRSVINLDELLLSFSTWQDSMSNLYKENTRLTNEQKSTSKQCSIYQQRVQDATEDYDQLRATVDKLHGALEQRCNFYDENQRLKEQIQSMTTSAVVLEHKHKEQMEEAMDNMETLRKAHRRETAQMQENIKQEMHKDVEAMEKTIQDKNIDIRQLQKENTELERAKHTEVVKLRLEYDAKMLKLQKQNARPQGAQSSSVNNEIFRKKLQHVKAESDREIAALKRKVQELESQTHRQGPSNSLSTKRRRII